MKTSIQNQFSPDYSVHPGEILEETLQARGLTKREVAARCGMTAKHLNQIIHGKSAVLPEVAISFERVLGVSANVWTNLQCNYSLHRARLEAKQESAGAAEWAKRFPVAEMIRRNWIVKPGSRRETASVLFQYFGMNNVGAWENWYKTLPAAYRASPAFKGSQESVAAWLRRGEILAQEIPTQPFNGNNLKPALDEIRKLTVKSPDEFEPAMKKICAEVGIVLILLAELAKTRLSGVAQWLTKDKALIMLSLRYKSNDHFWFSFFHEAGHLILHSKQMTFIDGGRYEDSELEKEADRFALNTLIPENKYRGFVSDNPEPTSASVSAFAKEVGIAPGIVVGRLQHDRNIGFDKLNNLKEKFQLVENN